MESLLILVVLGVLAFPLLLVWLANRVSSLSASVRSLAQRVLTLEHENRTLQARLTVTEEPAAETPVNHLPTPLPGEASPPIPARPVTPALSSAPQPPARLQPVAERCPVPVPATATGPIPPAITPPRAIPALAVRNLMAATARPATAAVSWEQFMGAKLFAWIGGFALFLGIAFFIKYSFDNNLVPPWLRVLSGFLSGVGLVVGGARLKRKPYEVTAQTLCATGIVILYAATFAAHDRYGLIGVTAAFALMTAVTATAFLLAVRLNALVVAILGIVGGFLTPPMLSSGQDQPLALFGYLALLDAGLIAVALHRRWFFLIGLGLFGTALMQFGWAARFFTAAKVFTAMGIFTLFNVLFLSAIALAGRLGRSNPFALAAAVTMPLLTFGFALWMQADAGIGVRPGVVFAFILIPDLCLLVVALLRPELRVAHVIAGGAAFAVLAVWQGIYLKPELLNWALGASLGLAVLHSAFPIALQRLRPGPTPFLWGQLFPPLGLLLIMLPMLKELAVPWLIWPVVMLIDFAAIGLALLGGGLLGVLAVLALTVAVTAVWLANLPVDTGSVGGVMLVTVLFAIFFFAAGAFLNWRLARAGQCKTAATGAWAGLAGLPASPEQQRMLLPAMSALMPFLLLILATLRLPMANPSPVFGVALLLVALLLAAARLWRAEALIPVGLVAVFALEQVWFGARFEATTALTPLLWMLGFAALFLGFPFANRAAFAGSAWPWITAAVSGPLHFVLVYWLTQRAWPSDYPGLLPAAFVIPVGAGLAWLATRSPLDRAIRNQVLAWFGGATLFFITLIFPIQFQQQWITLGWALEGAALLWLFHRVPHPGLRLAGAALLAIAFVRLALNPDVLGYHPRGTLALLNWYLYAYGIVAVCLFMGARLLAPPHHQVRQINLQALLATLGTILAFLLLNIELADYFTAPGSKVLTFDFSVGNLGRDTAYSIAWALFALALLLVGIWKRLPAARYAALGLLGVTLLKLFFRDLVSLSALHRIGAFIGVAVVSISASVLYQRFFALAAREEGKPAPAP